ncbi:MAG TPA: hypothetical protein VEH84_16010 [Alphaproteobacteria bacterium]|nr:hypothetical protein [Alphaproteobacteria bacterium]
MQSTIRSVWALDLMILLRQDPGRAWGLDALVRELRSSHSALADIVAAFKRDGLIGEDPPGQYRWQPSDGLTDRLAEDLARSYATHPVAVVKAILATPNDRLQTFADAFKIKKD